MYRLWLNGLYGLYGPWCPLSSKRPINWISLCLSLSVTGLAYSIASSDDTRSQVISRQGISLFDPEYCCHSMIMNDFFALSHTNIMKEHCTRQCNRKPGSHFTKVHAIIFEILWKIFWPLIIIPVIQLGLSFAYARTAGLSWHVQHCDVI